MLRMRSAHSGAAPQGTALLSLLHGVRPPAPPRRDATSHGDSGSTPSADRVRAATGGPTVLVRRVYDDSAARDRGHRVLVDRLWPRGISKERAALDEWCKDVAPSTELRKWYAHDPQKFREFSRRYVAELSERPEQGAALDHLRELAGEGPLILLTASRLVDLSEAAVLAGLIRG